MSVLMTLRIEGDPGRIEQALTSDGDRLKTVSDRSKDKGAIHHRFYASADGSGVLVVDEWESAEAFQQFFAESSEIPQMMSEAGVTSQPEATFWTELDTPDKF
jgi:heme-degrading monooxygenase HmoA